MASYERDCAGCNRHFTAKAPNAKWCSAACKKRAARVRGVVPPVAPEDSRLVERLRTDLTEADAVDTFEGLLALELAQRVTKAGPQGFSTLVRELRVVRAAALGEELPTVPDPGDPLDGPDGEHGTDAAGMALVLEIEERRDAKRTQAAATG